MMIRILCVLWLVVGYFASAIGPTYADPAANFPSETVRIIVPTAPGGTADAVPRLIAAELSSIWKQSVVVENLTGGGGNIGAHQFSLSKPDGYTLMSAPPNSLTVNESLYQRLSYSPKDFQAITILTTTPNVLVVGPKSNFHSVLEIIDYAKKNPDTLTYASAGTGSTGHLAGAQFEYIAGIKLRHVPYRGTAPAMNDVLGGHVDMMFDPVGSSLELFRAGTTRMLMICSEQRAEKLPEIPTAVESGLKNFISTSWLGLVAPAGTPPDIVAKINKDVVGAMRTATVQERLMKVGLEAVGNSPSEAAQFLLGERVRWAELIKAMGLQIKE